MENGRCARVLLLFGFGAGFHFIWGKVVFGFVVCLLACFFVCLFVFIRDAIWQGRSYFGEGKWKERRIHKEPKSVLSATQMYSNSLCRLLLLLTHQDAPALPVRLAFLLLDLIRLCFHLLVSHPDVDTLVIFLLGRCSLISHHLPGKQDVSFN